MYFVLYPENCYYAVLGTRYESHTVTFISLGILRETLLAQTFIASRCVAALSVFALYPGCPALINV